MKKTDISILFLGKKDDAPTDEALEFCRRNCNDLTIFMGKRDEKMPKEITEWKGDYIISFSSVWILPGSILGRAKVAAINFHPGSPSYPGYGCYNQALYEGAKEYGVTCHYMVDRVDSGDIIRSNSFSISPSDSVKALINKTDAYKLELYYEIMDMILKNKTLTRSGEKWERRPFTKKECRELYEINVNMSSEEIARRVRATSYENWQPFVCLGGFLFELKPEVVE